MAVAVLGTALAPSSAGAAAHARKAGGGPFRPWERHPAIALEIAVAGVGNGWVEMFHIGTNHVIYRKAPSAGINSWQALPGTYATKIAATMGSDGRVWLAYVGPRGGIYFTRQVAPGGRFDGWAKIGGTAKDIAIAPLRNGYVHLFHIGTDNVIYRVATDTRATGWTRMGGTYAKRISAATTQDGRVEIAHIGSDNNVYISWQSSPGSGFGPWRKYAAHAQDIALSGVGNGPIELFEIGPGNTIYRLAPWSGINSWRAMPGTYAKRIAANVNREGRVELAHIGRDNAIYLSWQTS